MYRHPTRRAHRMAALHRLGGAGPTPQPVGEPHSPVTAAGGGRGVPPSAAPDGPGAARWIESRNPSRRSRPQVVPPARGRPPLRWSSIAAVSAAVRPAVQRRIMASPGIDEKEAGRQHQQADDRCLSQPQAEHRRPGGAAVLAAPCAAVRRGCRPGFASKTNRPRGCVPAGGFHRPEMPMRISTRWSGRCPGSSGAGSPRRWRLCRPSPPRRSGTAPRRGPTPRRTPRSRSPRPSCGRSPVR